MEDAKIHIGPVLAGCIVLGVGGWVGWTQFIREEKPGATTTGVAPGMTAAGRAAAEAEEAEQAYRRALEVRADDAELAQLLDVALQKQNAALKLEPASSAAGMERLTRLEAARRSLSNGSSVARSLMLEEQAAQERKEGREREAIEKLREALSLQRTANANAPAAERNLGRENRLAREVDEIDAGPLRAMVEAARTLAVAAVARESWAEAQQAFQEARAAQAEINQRFPGTRHASAAALEQFDVEIASISAQSIAARSVLRAREGAAAAAAGQVEEAEKAFAEAVALQREVNEKYPRSRVASPGRMDELAVQRDAALAAPDLARIQALAGEAAGLLREYRTAEAVERIAAAAALLEKTTRLHPRARVADASLQAQLNFLNIKQADLGPVQGLVRPRLVAMGARTSMLDTEVPQELYQRVMNANPSRNSGRGLPVDSVTWAEAMEFCQRLSWMLGQRVRLPTEAEFRAVVGNGVSAMWSADSSDGRAHEVGRSAANVAGFFDLLGNLAEWLQPATEAGERAPLGGGSFIDAVDTLRRVPVATVEKRERQRHIGFRFVVE